MFGRGSKPVRTAFFQFNSTTTIGVTNPLLCWTLDSQRLRDILRRRLVGLILIPDNRLAGNVAGRIAGRHAGVSGLGQGIGLALGVTGDAGGVHHADLGGQIHALLRSRILAIVLIVILFRVLVGVRSVLRLAIRSTGLLAVLGLLVLRLGVFGRVVRLLIRLIRRGDVR